MEKLWKQFEVMNFRSSLNQNFKITLQCLLQGSSNWIFFKKPGFLLLRQNSAASLNCTFIGVQPTAKFQNGSIMLLAQALARPTRLYFVVNTMPCFSSQLLHESAIFFFIKTSQKLAIGSEHLSYKTKWYTNMDGLL